MSESVIPSGKKDQYEMLRPSVRQIIDRIYGGKESFIDAVYENPLEKYLIHFSAYMADNTTIRVIADRIGLFITIDEDTPISFIDGINQYLDLIDIENTRSPYHNDSFNITLNEIINMELNEFVKLAPSLGIFSNPEFYYGDRLMIITEKLVELAQIGRS